MGVETGQKSKAEFLTTTQFDLEAALAMSVQSQRERSSQKIAYHLTLKKNSQYFSPSGEL